MRFQAATTTIVFDLIYTLPINPKPPTPVPVTIGKFICYVG
jgi:hypothetical protein